MGLIKRHGKKLIIKELYKRINWEWYRNKDTNYFYIGYTPEKGKPWFAKEYIGIDKGIESSLNNYYDNIERAFYF